MSDKRMSTPIRRDANPGEYSHVPTNKRTHGAELAGPHRGKWYGHCLCGWRIQYTDDRQAARDAVDAHRIFHHITGAYLCGWGFCGADRSIKRIRDERALPERACTPLATRRGSRLRNLGVPPADVIGEYAEHVALVIRSDGHR